MFAALEADKNKRQEHRAIFFFTRSATAVTDLLFERTYPLL